MRRTLVLQAAGVTSIIALALLIPIALLMKDLASQRAIDDAQQRAEGMGRLIAAFTPSLGLKAAATVYTASDLEASGISVVGPDGTILGAPLAVGEIDSPEFASAQGGSNVRGEVPGGIAVYSPVVQVSGVAVVRVFVPDSELNSGVLRAWLTLALLGVGLVGVATLTADQIGRSVVRSVTALSDTAANLGRGHLDTRVDPSGPPEIEMVGEELNRLASQITFLLQQERDAAADLSHRLRTPLTALRLDTEALAPGPVRDRMLDDLAEVERTVDFIIQEARRPGGREPDDGVDLIAVLQERIAFWQPLADEQSRKVLVDLPAGAGTVALKESEAAALVDALIENVFAHTAEGTPLSLAAMVREDDVMVALEDGGPGFVDGGVLERGRSSRSSTGLGLDIVRKTTEKAGGDIRLGTSRRLGGAAVVIRMPIFAG